MPSLSTKIADLSCPSSDTVYLIPDINTIPGLLLVLVIEVADTFKDNKVLVYKYKSKKDYHRLIGHRQQYTNIRIKDIVLA